MRLPYYPIDENYPKIILVVWPNLRNSGAVAIREKTCLSASVFRCARAVAAGKADQTFF